jgi:carbonic anhydrase
MRSFLIAAGLGLTLSACTTAEGSLHSNTTPHPSAAAEHGATDPKAAVQSLFDGNGRFVSGHVRTHDFGTERKALTSGQHPKAIVLSCSDSRLPPELIFDQSLGEIFVVRSAGNVADAIGLASIEYAAEHLHTHVLVVLGHEKCGAVTAATQGGKMPTKNLEALMAEIGPSLDGLLGKYTGEELVHHGVEANVTATANEVLDRSPLLTKMVKEGELEVIQAVYDLDTGQVRELAGPDQAAAHVH